MRKAEHRKECLMKLGNEWAEVHVWLDEFARDYFPWPGHRQIRHHKEGVEEVRKKWGDEAARAAELHIIADGVLLEGKIPTKEETEKGYGPLKDNPFKDMMNPKTGKPRKIVFAANTKIDQLLEWVNHVLEAVGHPEALVTDLSTIGDFPSGRVNLDKICKKLGFEVAAKDYIWEVAEQVRAKKWAGG